MTWIKAVALSLMAWTALVLAVAGFICVISRLSPDVTAILVVGGIIGCGVYGAAKIIHDHLEDRDE